MEQALAQVSASGVVKRAAIVDKWLSLCSPLFDPPAGVYAAWWREEDDPRFASSGTFEEMKRAYASLPGVEGHVIATIAKHCMKGAPPGTVLPLPPPDNLLAVGVNTPIGVVILRMSGEKGIQFLFPRSTPRADREMAWAGLAALAEGAQAILAVTGKEETPSESRVKPEEWWSYATERLGKIEASGKIVSAFSVMYLKMGASSAVNVDTLIAAPGGRVNFAEFPTEGMMQHYESVLKMRMEGQAEQMSLIR